MLYRELAPISNEAWAEIDERASEVLKSYLSARKVVKVNGPKGLSFNVISEGRLGETLEEGDICYANYKVLPLTESRIEFEMDRWELDNVSRGAKDVDYGPLEEALEKVALFEENAVYNGLKNAGIVGLKGAAEGKAIKLGENEKALMESITEGVLRLRRNYAGGAYSLVVGKDAYKRIVAQDSGYPLSRRIENLIEGKIILSHVVEGAYLIPYNSDDLELTIGRDFSIGYQEHDAEKVKFFVAETFAFRVLDPALIVKFSL
ncbi:family 1 encapsulin nanocompartment shell protein [Gudongella sp. DL1XJH-153]|uniref:family 1 encapsulin nanocompartment shell protein n=1 Tax=Gudongella sp. DL1XJH-153 TaxID=3409804 RepID=UPI003BB6E7ED